MRIYQLVRLQGCARHDSVDGNSGSESIIYRKSREEKGDCIEEEGKESSERVDDVRMKVEQTSEMG
jgi:hypothetical protein